MVVSRTCNAWVESSHTALIRKCKHAQRIPGADSKWTDRPPLLWGNEERYYYRLANVPRF